MSPHTGSARRALFALTVGMILFTLYGSYVPFRFQERAWNDVTAAFESAMTEKLRPESRSDFGANLLLGVPLGFFLLGVFRVDQKSFATTLLTAGFVLPFTAAFAAVVEFGQLYTLNRNCCGSDVLAQTIGSAAGILAWCLIGQRAVDFARKMLANSHWSIARWVGVYLLVLAAVEWLPLDLTLSPADLYRRLRNNTTVIPFSELQKMDAAGEAKKIENWAELVVFSLPLGILLALMPGRWHRWSGFAWVAAFGLVAGAVLEFGQWFAGRFPSTTDVLMIAGGTVLGWVAGRTCSEPRARTNRWEWALVWGQMWLAFVALSCWTPFNFQPGMADRFESMTWIPLAEETKNNYLWAMILLVERCLLFVPFGVLGVWVRQNIAARGNVILAALLAGLLAAALEYGKFAIPMRYPSPTNVVLAVIGAWLGGEATRLLGARRVQFEIAPRVMGMRSAEFGMRN